jgi:ATP-dependent Clp protease protease subunit
MYALIVLDMPLVVVRYALPHAKVMLHQPSGGVGGQCSDIQIQADEIVKTRRVINEVLSVHTGKSIEELASQTERDKYLTAEEAKEWGVVDEVLSQYKKDKKDKK